MRIIGVALVAILAGLLIRLLLAFGTCHNGHRVTNPTDLADEIPFPILKGDIRAHFSTLSHQDRCARLCCAAAECGLIGQYGLLRRAACRAVTRGTRDVLGLRFVVVQHAVAHDL